MKNIEIAIVGAGPAGLGAALELNKLGYKDILLFDREDEAGGVPRHCGHLGFGLVEFKRFLSGPNYATKLVKEAKDKNIDIELKHTLIDIDNNILKFATPNGVQEYSANKIILALGARETPRSTRLVSGSRSPNIITTGALQRFAYMQKFKPFKSAVIIGSEVVSYSALMSAKHIGIEIKAIIEEDKNLNSFTILKPLSEYILSTPVKVGYEIVDIEVLNKDVKSITIQKDGKDEKIECDGIIFTGGFTPESAVMQKSFQEFNYTNNSLHISQNFQSKNSNIFLAGNVIRGALTAFNCYLEAKKVANFVDSAIKNSHKPTLIPIEVDDNIQWYYPSLIDITQDSKNLTKLRVNGKINGTIIVELNGRRVFKKEINASSYNNIIIPALDIELREDDKISIRVES